LHRFNPALLSLYVIAEGLLQLLDVAYPVAYGSLASCWFTVTSAGQVIVTGAAAVTVNVALHVTADWHELFTVKVTVLLPPQADGAPVLLFVNIELHPPLTVALDNQLA